MRVEANTITRSENQTDESDNPQGEVIEEEWDDSELTSLVVENEHTIVECPWEPGSEMTLSAVTLEWPVPIRAHNVDSVIATLRQLLENAEAKRLAKETEENKTEEDAETIEPSTKDTEAVEKAKAAESKQQSIDDEPKPTKAKNNSTNLNEVTVTKTANPVSSTLVNNAIQSQQPETADSPNREQQASASSATIRTESDPTFSKPSVPTTTRSNYAPSSSYLKTEAAPLLPPKLYMSEKKDEIFTRQITLEEQAPNIVLADKPAQPISAVEPEVLGLDSINETSLELDGLYADDEYANVESQIVELNIDPTFITSAEDTEYPNNGNFGSEQNAPSEINPERIEQAENILAKVAERVGLINNESAQQVHEIIATIVEIPTKIELDISEVIISETDAKNELVEQFAKLLDVLDIDHTPDLLESLAELALDGHFALEGFTDLEETDELAQNSTTQKIVKQIYVALNNVVVEANQACAVGKTALQHFGLSIAA